jgi:dienelactone hydrolase
MRRALLWVVLALAFSALGPALAQRATAPETPRATASETGPSGLRSDFDRRDFDRRDPEAIVQLPDVLEWTVPSADVPPAFKAYHGAWGGRWDDGIAHVLVVERIDRDGAASVVYAWGDSVDGDSIAGWQRIASQITPDGLTVQRPGGAPFVYRVLGDGQIDATSRWNGRDGKGLFRRIDRARLSRTFTVDDTLDAGERVYMPHLAAKMPGVRAPVQLEARLYRPPGSALVPLAIVNHASDIGRNLKNSDSSWLEAQWLLSHGFAVLVPMRRGRGRSGGIYGEATYDRDHAGQVTRISQSVDEAVEDLTTTIAYGRALPFVRPGPVLLVGQSRGGFLSVIYAGRYPADVQAVVNFAGVWMGGPPELAHFNLPYVFEAGRSAGIEAGRPAGHRVPQLWIYGAADETVTAAQAKAQLSAFQTGGGLAQFELIGGTPPAGHGVRFYRDRWQPAADAFLKALPN